MSVQAPDRVLEELEPYRRELTGYCYRMLGSAFDADDAVQETLVRAWQARDRFEGRSSLRSWLYRIATNTCLDALRSRQRRALPMDLSSPVPSTTAPGEPLPENVWVTPLPDGDVAPASGDPADRSVLADEVRLAFVAALQHLPPKQRAVLVLREVLCWQASEVAELLDTTVAGVNSALQRARATLASHEVRETSSTPLAEDEQDLLARYVSAFEAYDIEALVRLLHEDAGFSMPPLALWLRGREDIAGWYLGYGIGCKDSRLVPVQANGMPAFAHYKRSASGEVYEPWSIQVLEVADGKIVHLHHFLGVPIFERFGLPLTLPA